MRQTTRHFFVISLAWSEARIRFQKGSQNLHLVLGSVRLRNLTCTHVLMQAAWYLPESQYFHDHMYSVLNLVDLVDN